MAKWQPKLNEEGNVELRDGLPVWITDEGKEDVVYPSRLHEKILELSREQKDRRELNEKLTAQLKAVEGIEDLDGYMTEAKKAIQTVKDLSDKEILDAQGVEQLKGKMRGDFAEAEKKLKKKAKEQAADFESRLAKKDEVIRRLLVSNRFASSPFFSGQNPRTTLVAKHAERIYGSHFKVLPDGDDNVKLVAYDHKGEEITSKKSGNMGDAADFDEAIEILLNSDPHRDNVLRSNSGGSGASGGTGGVKQDSSPQAQLKVLREAYAKAQEARDGSAMAKITSQIFAVENAMKGSPR